MFTEEISAARQRRDEANATARAADAAADAARKNFRALLLAHLLKHGIPADLASLSEEDFGAIYSVVSHELGRAHGKINAAKYYAGTRDGRTLDLTAARAELAKLDTWAQSVLAEVDRRAGDTCRAV